jgi:hypothetical protein
MFWNITIHDNQIHKLLNATSVGKSFLLLAQISAMLVINAKMYSSQMLIPNISAGTMMIALANQLMASMTL